VRRDHRPAADPAETALVRETIDRAESRADPARLPEELERAGGAPVQLALAVKG